LPEEIQMIVSGTKIPPARLYVRESLRNTHPHNLKWATRGVGGACDEATSHCTGLTRFHVFPQVG